MAHPDVDKNRKTLRRLGIKPGRIRERSKKATEKKRTSPGALIRGRTKNHKAISAKI